MLGGGLHLRLRRQGGAQKYAEQQTETAKHEIS
jgi:hypothetical protein